MFSLSVSTGVLERLNKYSGYIQLPGHNFIHRQIIHHDHAASQSLYPWLQPALHRLRIMFVHIPDCHRLAFSQVYCHQHRALLSPSQYISPIQPQHPQKLQLSLWKHSPRTIAIDTTEMSNKGIKVVMFMYAGKVGEGRWNNPANSPLITRPKKEASATATPLTRSFTTLLIISMIFIFEFLLCLSDWDLTANHNFQASLGLLNWTE
jgi:hypothetical protein